MQATQEVKKELLRDFGNVINEAEQLLKSIAHEGGDRTAALRAKMEQNLNTAKQRLQDLEGTIIEKGKLAARATNEYVHENPWRSIGAVAGVSIITGIAIGVILGRR
ncbi:MAG: DUF883 family protein [Gallionellaceae bacterium]|nr:DUF883 family protein [Gallionellaceae bacterium]